MPFDSDITIRRSKHLEIRASLHYSQLRLIVLSLGIVLTVGISCKR